MRIRSMATGAFAALLVAALPSTVSAQSAPEFTSLRLLRDKGIISQAEYDSAIGDLQPSTGDRGADSTTLVVSRWATTLYGFLEGDFINDSTQSFSDVAGNTQVQRPGGRPLPAPANPSTYAGDHGRTTFSVRNSRFGLHVNAPEVSRIRASGMLEMDFLGATLPIGEGNAYNGTEAAAFTSPTLRLRHAFVRVETPVVDVLVGQYWDLFGWQAVYQPNTVEIQGVPGELYSRDPQVRLSKAFRSHAVTLEIAAAALRPPSRNSQIPEFQGGLRFSINPWTGRTTTGATGSAVMPASIAVTGDQRHFVLPEFSQVPVDSVSKDTWAIAVDAFIPVIPASSDRSGNALSLNGELVTGSGISNLYTGLTGGIAFPSISNTSMTNPPLTYPQDIDNGMVVYDYKTGNLHAIQWTTLLAGLQYYLPGVQGRLWVSGNYARLISSNIQEFTAPVGTGYNPLVAAFVPAEQVRKSEDWFDVNVFGQITPATRVGAEYATFYDHYVDGTLALNRRIQVSAFFIF